MGNVVRKRRASKPGNTSYKQIAVLKRAPEKRQHVRMSMDQFPGITFDWKHKLTILEAHSFGQVRINSDFVINMFELVRFIDRHDHQFNEAELKNSKMVVSYGNLSQSAQLDRLLHTLRNLVLWDFTVLDKGRQWLLVSCSVSKRPKSSSDHRRVYILD